MSDTQGTESSESTESTQFDIGGVTPADLGTAEVTVTDSGTDAATDTGDYGSYATSPRLADLGMGTGRRKEAVVRARVVRGSGQWTLNGKPLDVYFPNKLHQQLVTEPFRVLDREGAYDVTARLTGGGVSGQAGALRLAIARAPIVLDPADRPALKKVGFLTRDARVTERKKYGLKKARKAPQYSKR